MKLRRKIFIAAAVIAAVSLASLYWPVPKSWMSPQSLVSFRILDRNNRVLREVLSDQSGSCRWLSREKIPAEVVAAAVAAEDRFFYFHPGVNVLSLLRASWQNITEGHIVSGGSTITQQLARNIHPGPRTVISKIRETWTALRLEKNWTKDQILTLYLNRIYYGNQAYGIEAASQTYFGKSCGDLTLAEAAFLAALPRSPARFHPALHDPWILSTQKKILNKVFSCQLTSESAYKRALRQKLKLEPVHSQFVAPHFCDFVLSHCSEEDKSSGRDIQTTLNLELQNHIQHLVKEHITSLSQRNITQGAVVVIDNFNGEIISMIGSRDFFDNRHEGQVNGAVSLRQPGSTLKPFTYGLALQQGMSAADVLIDGPIQYSTPSGPYQPVNYDHKFHGPVRIRQALACSYNIPAVQLTERLGTERLYIKLKQAGFTTFVRPSSYYGVGLTLGNGEVTLLELTQAYSALSRGGVFQSASWRREESENRASIIPETRVFSPEVSYILTHILSDPDARIPAFGYRSPLRLPFPCAVKTGTSKDFRDNWAVGFTPSYTVGVWAGNFNGKPMHTVSGVTGCGQLFRDIMLLLHRKNPPLEFTAPKNLIRRRICSESGLLVSSDCPGAIEEIFIPGTEPKDMCGRHDSSSLTPVYSLHPESDRIRIIQPSHGNIYQIDPVLKSEYQTIPLRAAVPAGVKITGFEWLADGMTLHSAPHDFIFRWPLSPGRHTIGFKAETESGLTQQRFITITVLD
jgi:penicillin-binding protein 1C